MTETKIVKRIWADSIAEGMSRFGGGYWAEIVISRATHVLRPDGSTAGVVVVVDRRTAETERAR